MAASLLLAHEYSCHAMPLQTHFIHFLILLFLSGIRYIEENDYPVRGTYGFNS